MTWGLLPVLLMSKGFSLATVGLITAIYPAVWGLGQLITGKMADIFPKKNMLVIGMVIQAIALFFMIYADGKTAFILLSSLLGWGTAMVYPTFLATVAENTHPLDRAKSIGVFRLWRDMGYAVGAIVTGIIADRLNLNAAILFIAVLTFVSGGIIQFRMKTEK
jgi:MFS family permease